MGVSWRVAAPFVAVSLGLVVTVRSSGGEEARAVQGPAAGRPTATEAEARQRCGMACHRYPPPDILPRSAWRDELVRMMLISEGVPEPAGSSNFLPLPPDWQPLLRFYEANAPEKLPDPEPWPKADPARLGLSRRALVPAGGNAAPAIANVRWVDIDRDGKLDVVATDMRLGQVLGGLARHDFRLEAIAELRNPAHIEPVDLDQDGIGDLLIPDLGSFQPADHQNGAVYWLRGSKNGRFTPTVLASGLGRAADARAADFDGDGDLDIVVAVFGWRRVGNVIVLENRTRSWSAPVFVPTVIDARNGAINVVITDANADGRPDVVALLAQQFESVVAYTNTGKGLTFTTSTLYAAPHPNWGSSGIDLADLDADGDLDVLMTHGDTFDDFVLKPYHGILWLENTGGGAYTPHTLATLPGAHRAQAVDLDGDKDLDVVAVAMVAGGGGAFESTLASVVWLEQVSPRQFERRTLEMGLPYHATLDVADADGDGRPDILVGDFGFARPLTSWVDLWTRPRK
jgi:hypothetical protein